MLALHAEHAFLAEAELELLVDGAEDLVAPGDFEEPRGEFVAEESHGLVMGLAGTDPLP